MKLEMKETATEFLFFVNNEPAARIKSKQIGLIHLCFTKVM